MPLGIHTESSGFQSLELCWDTSGTHSWDAWLPSNKGTIFCHHHQSRPYRCMYWKLFSFAGLELLPGRASLISLSVPPSPHYQFQIVEAQKCGVLNRWVWNEVPLFSVHRKWYTSQYTGNVSISTHIRPQQVLLGCVVVTRSSDLGLQKAWSQPHHLLAAWPWAS